MILIRNSQRKIPININNLNSAAIKMLHKLKYDDFNLNIWITTNTTIRKYNKQYRNKNKATDILSFPYHSIKAGKQIIPKINDDKNLGDIIISAQYVKKDLKRWQQKFDARMIILLAHGISHLIGYDHQTESEYKEMQKVEAKLLKTIIL